MASSTAVTASTRLASRALARPGAFLSNKRMPLLPRPLPPPAASRLPPAPPDPSQPRLVDGPPGSPGRRRQGRGGAAVAGPPRASPGARHNPPAPGPPSPAAPAGRPAHTGPTSRDGSPTPRPAGSEEPDTGVRLAPRPIFPGPRSPSPASSSIGPAPGLGGRAGAGATTTTAAAAAVSSSPPSARAPRPPHPSATAARRAVSSRSAAAPAAGDTADEAAAPPRAPFLSALPARAAARWRGLAATLRASALARLCPPWLAWGLALAAGAVVAAWRAAAPFPLRRLVWAAAGHAGPAGPPHPTLHASPRLAALRAAASRGEGGPSTVTALGFPPDGRLADPLAEVPAWRLEALVGRRLSESARRRVRAALALPSSLDGGAILSRTGPSLFSLTRAGSGAASASSSSSDEGGEGEGEPADPGHAPSLSTPAGIAAVAARPPGAAYEFERLEFLGDAVLEVGAREWALARFPRASEHLLSNAARGLVCGRTLLAVAASPRLRLDVYVAANAHAMGSANYLTTWSGAGGASALVDAFEALVSEKRGEERERERERERRGEKESARAAAPRGAHPSTLHFHSLSPFPRSAPSTRSTAWPTPPGGPWRPSRRRAWTPPGSGWN